jgi:hypothetical protein
MDQTSTTQFRRPNRREVFNSKQAEEARRFELHEKVATAISDAVAPLAVDAREAQSVVHIQVRGGLGLPDIRLELDGCGVRDADEDPTPSSRSSGRTLPNGQQSGSQDALPCGEPGAADPPGKLSESEQEFLEIFFPEKA